MKHLEGSFKGAGGLSLYYHSWNPQGQGKELSAAGEAGGAIQGLISPLVLLKRLSVEKCEHIYH